MNISKISRRHLGIVALALASAPSVSHAEFSQGLGNIAAATKEASAKLSDALKVFYQMDASVTRGQLDQAASEQRQLIDVLSAAAQAYAETKTDGHVLQPLPKTVEEKYYVGYFVNQAEAYGLKPPFTQEGIIRGSADLIYNFMTLIKEQNVEALSLDLPTSQRLVNKVADMQKFLVAATTMLTLG